MPGGARSPEELETMFEDACVLGDPRAAGCLFETGATFSTVGTEPPIRGRQAITATLCELWRGGRTYVPSPPLVLQAGPTALIVAGRTVQVVHRRQQEWRYLISRVDIAQIAQNYSW